MNLITRGIPISYIRFYIRVNNTELNSTLEQKFPINIYILYANLFLYHTFLQLIYKRLSWKLFAITPLINVKFYSNPR